MFIAIEIYDRENRPLRNNVRDCPFDIREKQIHDDQAFALGRIRPPLPSVQVIGLQQAIEQKLALLRPDSVLKQLPTERPYVFMALRRWIARSPFHKKTPVSS